MVLFVRQEDTENKLSLNKQINSGDRSKNNIKFGSFQKNDFLSFFVKQTCAK